MDREKSIIVNPVLAAEIYPEFTCPCCGQPLDKENPCCDAMVEMIDFIDKKVRSGKSSKEVMLLTAKQFGLDRLASAEKRDEIKTLLAISAPSDSPKININKTKKDLGNVSRTNGTVSTDFMFTNNGKSDLVINKLSASCGCTSASIIYKGQKGPVFTMEGHGKKNPTDWNVAIAPGDTALIRVYYDPTVHKNLTGPVTRTVSIFSNDPVEFEKKVTITLKQI